MYLKAACVDNLIVFYLAYKGDFLGWKNDVVFQCWWVACYWELFLKSLPSRWKMQVQLLYCVIYDCENQFVLKGHVKFLSCGRKEQWRLGFIARGKRAFPGGEASADSCQGY